MEKMGEVGLQECHRRYPISRAKSHRFPFDRQSFLMKHTSREQQKLFDNRFLYFSEERVPLTPACLSSA